MEVEAEEAILVQVVAVTQTIAILVEQLEDLEAAEIKTMVLLVALELLDKETMVEITLMDGVEVEEAQVQLQLLIQDNMLEELD